MLYEIAKQQMGIFIFLWTDAHRVAPHSRGYNTIRPTNYTTKSWTHLKKILAVILRFVDMLLTLRYYFVLSTCCCNLS